MRKTSLAMSLTVAAIVTASSIPAHAAPNLLVNGDFEASSSATTTPPGWTNIGHMDGVLSYANVGEPAYDGLYFYDIGGAGNNGNASVGEGITQSVATSIGSTYTLTFGYSGENVPNVGDETLRVTIGDSTFDFVLAVDGSGVFRRAFTTQTLDYVATGLNTAVSFTLSAAPNGSGNNDPLIDGVILSLQSGPPPASVPEPASIALLGLGFGGIALARRRRRSPRGR